VEVNAVCPDLARTDLVDQQEVQSFYAIGQPLSAFLKQQPPPPAPKIDFLPATTAGIKANFFEYLDAALQYVPTDPEAKDIRAKLASMESGNSAVNGLPLPTKLVITSCMGTNKTPVLLV
jgi:hypothetical protein